MQFQNAQMINYQLSQSKQQQFQQPATFGSYSGYNNVISTNPNYMALNRANVNMLAQQNQYAQPKQSNIWNMTTDEMFEKKRLGWQFLPNGTIVIPCAAHKNRVGAVYYGYPNMAFGSKQQFIQWKKAEKKKYESKGGNVQQCSSSGRCFVDDSEGYEAWINGGRDTWISNLQLQMASNSGSGSKPVAQSSRTFTTPGINQNFTTNGNTFNL